MFIGFSANKLISCCSSWNDELIVRLIDQITRVVNFELNEKCLIVSTTANEF